MPWLPLYDAGILGLNFDTPDYMLPPEALTRMKNVRVRAGALEPFGGIQQVGGGTEIPGYWLLNVEAEGNRHWIYAGLEKVYIFRATTHKEITKTGGYNATTSIRWNGGLLGGVPILNNGVDPPQMWLPQDFSTPQLLQDLSNWPTGYTARVIRPFRNFLVALHLNDGTTDFPQTLRWSHPADPGNVPVSWDIADPTRDAGQVDFLETPGRFIDSRQLGGVNILYKDDSIWRMQHIGGDLIFNFAPISRLAGLLSTHAVAAFPGGHALITPDDIVVHNMTDPQSILEGRLRRWFVSNVNEEYAHRSFAAHHPAFHEIWFCVPTGDDEWPCCGLVWDYRNNVFSIRDLPELSYAIAGQFAAGASIEVWDTATVTWDNYEGVWDSFAFGVLAPGLTGISATKEEVYQFDVGFTDEGSPVETVAERTRLSLVGRNRQDEPRADPTLVKHITRVRPRLTGAAVTFHFGQQLNNFEPIQWIGPFEFDPSYQEYIDVQFSTKLISYRIESSVDAHWQLGGIQAEMTFGGEF